MGQGGMAGKNGKAKVAESPTGYRNRIIDYGVKPADQFLANPKNARVHPQFQRDVMKAALEEVGFVAPVIESKSGVLLDGHERIWQALQRDNAPVPFVVVDVDEAEEDYVLATFDPITSLANYDAKLLDDLLRDVNSDQPAIQQMLAELAENSGLYGDEGSGADDPGAQIDRAAELQEQWQVKRGDLWIIPSKSGKGEHRLLCGDSTNADDAARVMGGERADCVFTSPPYAVGIDYGEYQDTIENLRVMLPRLAQLWLTIVVDGGYAVVNFGDIAGGRNIAEADEPCEYPMGIEYFPVFRKEGWLLWSRRIWCKPTARVNSLWCIGSNRASTDFEHLWTWRKTGNPIIKRVDGEFSSVNGWYQSSHLPGVDEGKEVHGAGMATGIAQWMVTVHSRKGSLVHEPFTGTGTTIVACEQLGRQARAIEIEPKYVAVTLQRLADMGLTPELQPS